jgi:pyruvate dehydrogenase E1 component alpha subunit
VLAVLRSAREAVARANRGGPTLLELKTYRWGGHFQGDPCKYRTREEEAQWKDRDPVTRFRAATLEAGAMSEAEIDALDAEAATEIREAIEFRAPAPSRQASARSITSMRLERTTG